MSKLPKRAIIIGGGASIRDGKWDIPISQLPLWKALKNEFTIGLNFLYRFMTPTVLMFVDYHFYMTEKQHLDKLPLIVGREDTHIGTKKDREGKLLCEKGKNLYSIKHSSRYFGQDSWEKGFYKSELVGIFSLTFAIACGFQEIYLLGYDCTAIDGKTHFYQDNKKIGYVVRDGDKMTGIGFHVHPKTKQRIYKTGTYNSDVNSRFKVYTKELSKIKIINVSPKSKINVFPKIDYVEFYRILEETPQTILQSRAREDLTQLMLRRLK